MKNPFKKSSIIDTVTNVAVGGAANVAMDYALNSIGETIGVDLSAGTTKHAVKIAVGALAGSMISNKYARVAFDGIATVGAADLIDSLVNGEATTTTTTTAPAGLPEGTIGRIRMGQRGFRRGRVAGIQGADFMGA